MKLNVAIDKIIESIREEKNLFEHRHILFVGENTTGKSRTISKIVKKLLDDEILIYYICSWNRKIINKRIETVKTFKDIDCKRVVTTRLDYKYFNNDIFYDELGTEVVMNEIYENAMKYSELFQEYLNIPISATEKKIDDSLGGFWSEDILEVNGGKFELLSDAQVSMMRILMEVNYANECNCKYVFIDEFDINLDHINSSGFLEWLKSKYPDIVFIISAHSLYTILNLADFDVVKIKKQFTSEEDNLCVVFDSNDLDNVDVIDKKLFGYNYFENELDEILSSSLKCVLSNIPIEKSDLELITKSEKLTTRQKVVFDFIKERTGEI